MFIGDDIYKWQLLDEVGATAYYAGKPHMGYHACKRLMDENLAPSDNKTRILDNFNQYEKIVTSLQVETAQKEVDNKIKEKEDREKSKVHMSNKKRKKKKRK